MKELRASRSRDLYRSGALAFQFLDVSCYPKIIGRVEGLSNPKTPLSAKFFMASPNECGICSSGSVYDDNHYGTTDDCR